MQGKMGEKQSEVREKLSETREKLNKSREMAGEARRWQEKQGRSEGDPREIKMDESKRGRS